MKTRLITAAVAAAIVITVLVFRSTLAAPIAIALLCCLATFEIFRATGSQSNLPLFIISLIFSAAIPFVGRGYIPISIGSAYYLFFLLFAVCVIIKFDPTTFEKMFVTMLMVCSITFGFVCAQTLIDLKHGMFYFLLAAFCAFITDAGAYFVGSAVGKTPLAPKISPKKTVEGAIGGFVCCVIVGITFAYIYETLYCKDETVQLLPLVICVLLAAAAGMVGDLIASTVKRRYGVKDYGKVMPGHGGIVDRCDSVCLTFPVVMLFAQHVLLLA